MSSGERSKSCEFLPHTRPHQPSSSPRLVRFARHFFLRLVPHLRLVFTSDGVGVGVVIRSVKRYDLVKIKRRSRKQSFLLCSRFRRLRSSENQIVGEVSRSARTKPITKRGNEHCDWFILPLLLPTPTIWFSLDRKRRNRKRSRKKMETF